VRSNKGIQRWSDSRFVVVGSLVLFCFCLATRIPLRPPFLSGWDPVNFALAIHHFDISQSQPHPPGYLVFVGLAKLLFWFLRDDNLSLTTLAALFSALSAVLIFLLAFYMYGRRTALLASAAWATCPLVWFHGIVSEMYATAGFGSSATALAVLLFWRSPSRLRAAWVGGVYALAAGLRPDLLPLLAPLVLFPFLRSAACRRRILYTFCSALVGYATWYIPTLASVGGHRNYSRLVAAQFSDALKNGSIFFGASLIAHVWMFTRLISGLVLGLLPLLVVAPVLYYISQASGRRANASSGEEPRGRGGPSGRPGATTRVAPTTPQGSLRASVLSPLRLWKQGQRRRHGTQADWSEGSEPLLLVVWAVPFLLFYSLIFIWKVGYCIGCLPPILLLLSRWVDLRAKRFWPLLFFSTVVNAGFFFLIPRFPERAVTAKSSGVWHFLPEALNRSLLSCQYDQIRFDQSVKKRYFEQIRKLLVGGNSAVVLVQRMPAECLNFRILQYYFPNVPVCRVVGLSNAVPGYRLALSISYDKFPSKPLLIEEGKGAERSATLATGKNRVLLLHPRNLCLEVNPRDGSAQELVAEDQDDRLDTYQMCVLTLTPTSSVDVTSGGQTISIVE